MQPGGVEINSFSLSQQSPEMLLNTTMGSRLNHQQAQSPLVAITLPGSAQAPRMRSNPAVSTSGKRLSRDCHVASHNDEQKLMPEMPLARQH